MIKITTESGSTYIFNTTAHTWESTRRGSLLEQSPMPLRTLNGTYTYLQDIEVGKRGKIHAPGLELGNRWIHTSVITSVREF